MKKLTIGEIKEFVKKYNGDCLSNQYENQSTPLLWRCEYGHTWEMTWKQIKRGSWCRTCFNLESENHRTKKSLTEMQELAFKRGGKCLSNTYNNANSRLEWECSEGHRWRATPGSVKYGSWCKVCAGSRTHTIEEMRKYAGSKGWKCLSDSYKNNKVLLEWQCENEHRWEATANNILRGSKCPRCSGKQILNIDDLHRLAAKRGGKCISSEYRGTSVKHEWECQQGHRWNAKPNSIQQGGWCPDCNFYFSEEKCRFIFETMFHEKFKKNRKVLKGYELDGYNSELNLGFEYHGIQHYKYIDQFFDQYEQFLERKRIDQLKEKMCLEKEIKLVVIPYYENENDNKLIEFIKRTCEDMGLRPVTKTIDLESFYKRIPIWESIHEIANGRGGKCLSKVFVNKRAKLDWECANGHIWSAPLRDVENGHWCLKCAGKEKLTIELAREIAASRGGECLSRYYENTKTPLTWRCAKGHVWKAALGQIKNQGSWCRECAGLKKQDIKKMKELAASRGGKCLSTKYKNANSKLEWQCEKGHRWWAKPGAVKFGSWCPECRGKPKGNICKYNQIAKEKGGECLSDQYVNSKTKLTFKCANNHVFNITPASINRGHWCVTCSAKERVKKRKVKIEDMVALAESKNGKCLSDKMDSVHDKLKWMCNKGHVWGAAAYNVKNGTWCKVCHYESTRRK